jgi:hypothetical protein
MEKSTGNKETMPENYIQERRECMTNESLSVPFVDSLGDRTEATTVPERAFTVPIGVNNTSEYSPNDGREDVQESKIRLIYNHVAQKGVSSIFMTQKFNCLTTEPY